MKAKSIPNHILKGYKRIKVPGQRIYMCNKEGVVINAKTGRKIKPFLSNSGYYYVLLNGKSLSIHRIVATLFVEKTNPWFNTVNHKNEIKTDNRSENLEWCSVMYNVNYGNAQKRKKPSEPFYPVSVKAEKDGEVVVYDSMAAASRGTGVNINSIRRCVDGTQKATKNGYIFTFIKRSMVPCFSPIRLIAKKDGKEIVFESTCDAEKNTGVYRMGIWRCLKGLQKTCKGWAFRYASQKTSANSC